MKCVLTSTDLYTHEHCRTQFFPEDEEECAVGMLQPCPRLQSAKTQEQNTVNGEQLSKTKRKIL
jgi:hypothetical protein